jgi:hypothetical protein
MCHNQTLPYLLKINSHISDIGKKDKDANKIVQQKNIRVVG